MLETKLSIISILYLLAAAQGVLLCGALLTSHKGLKKANRYLAALVFVFSLDMLSFFIDEVDSSMQWIRLQIVIFPREFFYGPLFYFYARELTQPNQHFLRNRQWLHFLPSLIYIASHWLLLLVDTPTLLAYINNEQVPTGWLLWVGIVGFIMEVPLSYLHVAVYFFIVYRSLKQHQETIKNNFSFTEKISLQWLKSLVVALLCIYCFWLLDNFLPEVFIPESVFEQILGLSIALLIYAVGYMGLRQPIIFTGTAEQGIIAPDTAYTDSEDKIVLRQSLLDTETLESLFVELEQTIQADKLYLNNELSLAELASVLGLSTHYLSEVINTQTQGNFYEYINRYRIEYAKTLLVESSIKLTVLDVAMRSGFNSKSAFYSAFKKQLNMTPSQYKAQH